MRNLLEIVTKCIDRFSERENIERFAAIVGGEAVILHGIPRTTLELDILYFPAGPSYSIDDLVKRLASSLQEQPGEQFEVTFFSGSRDPFDPLRHDLIIITDAARRFKKLDILIANYQWELEGFQSMDSPSQGPLQPFPKPYLVGMKLMAGGGQAEEDIRNLFLILDEADKHRAWELARLINHNRNLSRMLTQRRRRR